MSETFDPHLGPSAIPAPVEEDLRADDQEFNPALEPKEAKAWLNLLRESEDAFEDYNTHCDNIDRQYANMERLANQIRDKEFQMFWANAEVLKPAIYASPPVPVVVPKFLDRRPVYEAAAEVMERCAVVAFDLANIDELMKLVRDDLALLDRGVAWCRYEKGDGGKGYNSKERVAIDFKNRRDFLHSISRNWREVTWVAGASYLTRGEARKRFYASSGDEYQDAEYKVDKEAKEVGGADNRERAKFWEIWSKGDKRVVWVSEGCENILDEDEPHLELRNFFPCPKPAYGTVQRGSLVPVPDVMQYKDQLEELNTLTGRIHALSEAIEAKGFYPAGGGELADAVQTAIDIKSSGRVLVPISNWAQFGGSKDVIIWLPIDQIAQTITGLVALRKEIINDIYQIMGLSDIMRGATDPQETLGAQNLKTQYGSVRVADKQDEMVRLARDLVEITLEIITEKFSDVTIVEMTQTQLPTTQMVERELERMISGYKALQLQVQQLTQLPQAQPAQGGGPGQGPMAQQQIQQQMQQIAEDIKRVHSQPTIDQVLTFIHDVRAKVFVLDIETDSTIIPNEQAEKQARSEFVGVLAQLLPQLAQMIQADPHTANFCGEILKFATAPYRAGRSLDGAIDHLVQMMNQKANQPQGDDPTTAQNKVALQIEQMKVDQQNQSDAAKLAFQRQQLQATLAQKDRQAAQDNAVDMASVQQDRFESQADMQEQQLRMQENRESHQMQMAQNAQKMQLEQQKARAQMVNQALTAQARAVRPPPPGRPVQ